MTSGRSEKKLANFLAEQGVAAATPSLRVQAFIGGRKKIDFQTGDDWTYYDWASLTKIVFSVSSLMLAVDEGDIAIGDRVDEWVPELSDFPFRLRDLVTHSAGLEWWKPFYERAKRGKDPGDAWRILIEDVLKSVRKHHARRLGAVPSVYSDLDFFLLGEILMRATLAPLGERWVELSDRLDLHSTCFHATKKTWAEPGVVWSPERVKLTAPTEYDRKRAKGCLQGVVHDENAWALGGAAPHAGLFGPIEDLSRYGLELRKLARGEKSRLPAVGARFLRRAIPRKQGDWALGFMMPTKGSASCGPRFSLSSIGHTGFTGTSLWYDPKQDLLVTILSNRVSPTRENKAFVGLRPQIHSEVVRLLI